MPKKSIPGLTDLATTHPALAAEWHPTKNGELSNDRVLATSAQKFWWVCSHGHEWAAASVSRVKGAGCPYCSGRVPVIGVNDLATTHPALAAEWHPTKNGDLKPSHVSVSSNKKIWWQCSKGHSWCVSSNSRKRGNGCPYCGNQAVLAGYNDMATTHPALAAEWHPTKNGDLAPINVLAGTHSRIWWLCSKSHEWEATGKSRVEGNGCPYCGNQAVLAGYNDMATTHPALAAEWHPTKNGDLTPRDVTAGTNRKIWWLCESGHEWAAHPGPRLRGVGCPTCATSGFDPNRPAILYFIANRDLRARKVGITNVGTTRLAAFAKNGWRQLLAIENADGGLVRRVENAMFDWLRGEHALPQFLDAADMPRTAGATETFSEEGPSDYEIMERIKAEFARLSDFAQAR